MTKKVEEDHIKAHEKEFAAALAKTTMSVRSNAAFVGLNKIREPLAFQAALKATGFKGIDGFCIPKGAGEPTRDVQELVDRAFTEAVEAASAVDRRVTETQGGEGQMAKRKTVKRKEHKIIRGLKEAIAHAKANGKPEPMVFEHAVVEKPEYERVSERVMAAINEMNAALQEAHECAEMRVFLNAKPRSVDYAMQFQPQIYRLTHSTMAFTVKVNEPKMQWRQVKDPAFEDAAGVGLSALQKRR